VTFGLVGSCKRVNGKVLDSPPRISWKRKWRSESVKSSKIKHIPGGATGAPVVGGVVVGGVVTGGVVVGKLVVGGVVVTSA